MSEISNKLVILKKDKLIIEYNLEINLTEKSKFDS